MTSVPSATPPAAAASTSDPRSATSAHLLGSSATALNALRRPAAAAPAPALPHTAPPASPLQQPTPDFGDRVSAANPVITCIVKGTTVNVSGPYISGASVSIELHDSGRAFIVTYSKLIHASFDSVQLEELQAVRGNSTIPPWQFTIMVAIPNSAMAYKVQDLPERVWNGKNGWTRRFSANPPVDDTDLPFMQPTMSPPKKARRLQTPPPHSPAGSSTVQETPNK